MNTGTQSAIGHDAARRRARDGDVAVGAVVRASSRPRRPPCSSTSRAVHLPRAREARRDARELSLQRVPARERCRRRLAVAEAVVARARAWW